MLKNYVIYESRDLKEELTRLVTTISQERNRIVNVSTHYSNW